MNLKTAIVDTLDPRPIKKATLYAAGTMLEGLALGLFISVLFPNIKPAFQLIAAAVLFLVGAICAVSAYSALKRRYSIIEKPKQESEATSCSAPGASAD